MPHIISFRAKTFAPFFIQKNLLLFERSNALKAKRIFDVTAAFLLLLIVLPLFLVLALIVRSDGGPAFFSQRRIGLHGRRFACYKFRSMRHDAEMILQQHLAQNAEAAAEWKAYQKLKKDLRITRFGAFLRRTSLDELPQLINVLKGDMSLVGPRPILPGQEIFYSDDISYYMSMRPGLTGPWQVGGRNKLTFAQRVELETQYVRQRNFRNDIVILLRTPPALLQKNQAF